MKKKEIEFIERLKELSNNAYAPYSNFHVVAYFENKDKTWFSGVNIENASYPNSLCAERVAIYSAINQNIALNNVKIIHIFSPNSKDFLSPCGECRQTIGEHINHNVEIRMYNNQGKYISKKFKDIFPYVIEPKNVKGEN